MTKQSLRTKFIIIMGLLVTVPIVLLTAISLFNTVNEGKKGANEVNKAQAGLVRESIGIIRSKNLESLKALATSPILIEYLDGTKTESKDEEVLLKNILTVNRNLDEGRSTGNSIAIADATGMQRLRTSGKNVDVSERDYFKEPMSGASEYSSDLIVSKSTGTAIITFSVPVYDKMGQNIIGIVQRNYDVSELQEMLASEVMQDKQEIVIVDRTGTVIAHSARSVNVEDPEKQDQNEFYTDSRGDKTSGNYVAPFMGDTWIISWEKIPGCDWIVASCRVQEVALANVYITAAAQLVIGVIMIVISIIIAIFVANSITKPLGAVNVSLAAMTEGRFERINKYLNRKDELGQIIRNTNEVMDKLTAIVGDIRSGANSVSGSSDELADTAEQMSRNAEDVSNAVQEIATGATQQADEIQGATEHIREIEDAVSNVQASTDELTEMAGRMQNASKDSVKSLQNLRKSSEEMNDAIDGISAKVSATSDAVGRINGMVDTISNIASQTNLLALNASIEAARAGDAGKGFAVVAEEIGKLATDSNNSAEHIKEEMDELLRQSQEAVNMADDVQKTNRQQQEVINDTFNSVNSMIGDIEETVKGVRIIADNAENCVAAKDKVVDAMGSLSAISEENAAACEETGASMEELSATVTTLAGSARSMHDVSNNLNDEVGFFKI